MTSEEVEHYQQEYRRLFTELRDDLFREGFLDEELVLEFLLEEPRWKTLFDLVVCASVLRTHEQILPHRP